MVACIRGYETVHVKYYDFVMINSLNHSLTNAIKFVPVRKFPLVNSCTVEFNSFVNCIVPWREMGGFIFTLFLIVSSIFFGTQFGLGTKLLIVEPIQLSFLSLFCLYDFDSHEFVQTSV